MSESPGSEPRRHFRVEGEWTVTAIAVDRVGVPVEFDAIVLNVSISGLLLEAAVEANLRAEKPLTLELPEGVGAVDAVVRRFLKDGEGGHKAKRWGVEFTNMTVRQRALWARFVFTGARLGRDPVEPEAA